MIVSNGQVISSEEYGYDFEGSRISKKSGTDVTKYIVDTNGALAQVVAELDGAGKLKVFYTRGDELISQERGGKISYYLYDGHGSVRMLADESGAVTDTYSYDAFGNILDKTGTAENNYLYCGEQFDGTTGFYYLRARYMNPSTGRFITMDEYQGSIFDPVSLHKYLYANANPVMYSDPSGYMSGLQTLVGLVGAIAIAGVLMQMCVSASQAAMGTGMSTLNDLRSSFNSLNDFTSNIITNQISDFSVDTDFSNSIKNRIIENATPKDNTTPSDKTSDGDKSETKEKTKSKPRGKCPPARRIKCKSKKEAYERAKRAGNGQEPEHHPNDPNGPHYHPNVPNSQRTTPHQPCSHDHYFY